MIEARRRKARRILDVQQDLQRLEEERLAALKSRKAGLASLQEEAVASLQGVFAAVAIKRLKSLGEESLRLDTEIERRSHSLRVLATRTKYAERLVRNYDQQCDRIAAEKDLMDIIERALRNGDDASLP